MKYFAQSRYRGTIKEGWKYFKIQKWIPISPYLSASPIVHRNTPPKFTSSPKITIIRQRYEENKRWNRSVQIQTPHPNTKNDQREKSLQTNIKKCLNAFYRYTIKKYSLQCFSSQVYIWKLEKTYSLPCIDSSFF